MAVTSGNSLPIGIAVLTVSDFARRAERQVAAACWSSAWPARATRLAEKLIVPDHIHQIRAAVSRWIADPEVNAIITTGGTGVTRPRRQRPRPCARCSTRCSTASARCSFDLVRGHQDLDAAVARARRRGQRHLRVLRPGPSGACATAARRTDRGAARRQDAALQSGRIDAAAEGEVTAAGGAPNPGPRCWWAPRKACSACTRALVPAHGASMAGTSRLSDPAHGGDARAAARTARPPIIRCGFRIYRSSDGGEHWTTSMRRRSIRPGADAQSLKSIWHLAWSPGSAARCTPASTRRACS